LSFFTRSPIKESGELRFLQRNTSLVLVVFCPGGLLSEWAYVRGWHFSGLLSGGLLSRGILSVHLLIYRSSKCVVMLLLQCTTLEAYPELDTLPPLSSARKRHDRIAYRSVSLIRRYIVMPVIINF